MKKNFILTLLMSIMLFCSCTGCSNKEENKKIDNDSVPSIEQMIINDTDSMQAKGNKFVWYETLILLNDYLDEENDGSWSEVVNIFQGIKEYERSADATVYKFQYFANGTFANDSVKGLWVEDNPLIDSLIKVPYDSAYALVNRVNFPKPHSRHVCLRNPVGPKSCNPQWVFGNINSQIWLDAVDGTIRTSNPAFPDNFKYAFSW